MCLDQLDVAHSDTLSTNGMLAEGWPRGSGSIHRGRMALWNERPIRMDDAGWAKVVFCEGMQACGARFEGGQDLAPPDAVS